MVMRTLWPGENARHVQEEVTDRIARKLQETPYTDFMRSYSRPGESLIFFQMKDSAPAKDVPEEWYQIRKKVGDIAATLPPGVQGPFFNDEFGDVYGSIFALSADGFSDEELRVYAERVRQELLRVPDVAKVALFGVQPEKVYVEVSQQRLAQLGLDFNQVIAQVGAQNAVEGAGVLDTGVDNLQLRVAGQFDSVDELARVPVRGIDPVTGAPSQLRLGDLARIVRGYADPPQVMVHHQGRPVVALGVAMARGGDIIALGNGLHAAVARIQHELPLGIKIDQVQDQPRAVARSVGEFV
jgi:multidrug efflux pump subunit AcrB